MEAILVKVFATALALSQVTTQPDTVKTQFDPVQDKAEVAQLLGNGCAYLKKAFDIENIDLDDLIATAMTDKQAVAGEIQGFKGLKFSDLHLAYRQFCKNEKIANSPVDLGEVIEFYNKAAADLPDHTKLKGLKLPGMTMVRDVKGVPFAELYEPEHRRHWVPLSEIPEAVQKAFVAAEDKRFFQHKGDDERSVIRAFITSMGSSKRQGGSTITQQVVKNLLVGDNISYERKIREVIVAARVEKTLSKQEILEVYLNAIYLGRGSWGVEMAARSYFGKSAKQLTLTEAAFLAGLVKGPNYYNPDRHRGRAQERYAYVLSRLQEDGAITDVQMKAALAEPFTVAGYTKPRRTTGFHAVDQLVREARSVAGIESLTTSSFEVRSTINPSLQRAAELALQDGLARYEQNTGRATFQGPETNLAEAIKKIDTDPKADKSKPSWQQALMKVRMPLYDVHWTPAIVIEKKNQAAIKVGLQDGRTANLNTSSSTARRNLMLHDVVYVTVTEAKNKQIARVDLRLRPTVQGAVVMLENSTGRILAMVGGFSYPLSQLNRASQSRRQPGSALKPLTYLAALSAGLQPNTLIEDAPITLPPIGDTRYAAPEDWWTPKNYGGETTGPMTLRRALENSKNLVTARLLDGGIANSAPESLDHVCRLAQEAQLYQQCERFYPFVLGAQPVRPLDLAGFYAAVANEGARPTPHLIDSIEQDGRAVYTAANKPTYLGSADRASVYQLRTFLQGVLARGTARAIAQYSPFLAGKTGTSDEENDAWFVGFSNDVTIAVWVGYDNRRGKRTLGPGQTGGNVSLPIFTSIMQTVWTDYAPRTPMRGPSPEASKQLIALPIDVRSGVRLAAGDRGAFMEQFKLDRSGRFNETQYRLVSRENAYSSDPWSDDDRDRDRRPRRDFESFFSFPFETRDRPTYIQPQPFNDDRYPRRAAPSWNDRLSTY